MVGAGVVGGGVDVAGGSVLGGGVVVGGDDVAGGGVVGGADVTGGGVVAAGGGVVAAAVGGGVGGGVGASTAPKTRVAPKNRDHQTGEIFTKLPVVGDWTIRPPPMYIPTWWIERQSFGSVAKNSRSPGSSRSPFVTRVG